MSRCILVQVSKRGRWQLRRNVDSSTFAHTRATTQSTSLNQDGPRTGSSAGITVPMLVGWGWGGGGDVVRPIVNLFLRTGKIPDQFRVNRTTVIPKKAEPESANDYRPIHTTRRNGGLHGGSGRTVGPRRPVWSGRSPRALEMRSE